jgi:hypothetical protein
LRRRIPGQRRAGTIAEQTLQIRVAEYESDVLYKQLVFANQPQEKTMKCLLLTFALCSAILTPSARAVDSLPYFGSLRAEVLNQLNLATNVVEPDKKLVSALRKALTAIDKTKPDYASGSKSLGKIASGLNRTSVSNVFAPVFQSTVADYVGALTGEEDELADRLATTFPSKSRTSAELALERLLAALQSANATDDIILAAKALAAAAKEFGTATKLTVKAEATRAGDDIVTATVNGAAFKSDSSSTQGTYDPATHDVTISGSIVSGSGLNTTVKTLTLFIDNVPTGTTTYPIGAAGASASALYDVVGVSGTGGVASTSGTLTITLDTVHKLIFGTFSFTATGTLGTFPISNGTFTATYQ